MIRTARSLAAAGLLALAAACSGSSSGRYAFSAPVTFARPPRPARRAAPRAAAARSRAR